MQTNISELQLIDIRSAARVLGISSSTLRQWLCRRRFPYVKVGGRTLISVRDITHFVAKNRVSAQERDTDSGDPTPLERIGFPRRERGGGEEV